VRAAGPRLGLLVLRRRELACRALAVHDGQVTFGDPAVWSTEAWRAEATAWLNERLADAGARRTGPIEQPRLRPWATLLRAPTTQGAVWLKAGGPDTGYEAALYGLLAREAPGHVLAPIGIDAARGWVALPDGGPSLGERLQGEARAAAMCAALPHYAELQRRLAPQAERLLELGVPDMRPAVMPHRFEQALAATGPSDVHGRLEGMRDAVLDWCRRLDDRPVPPSLDHNDLHDRNVVGDPRRPRFYDWGDSVVAHPFASMLVPLSMGGGDRLRDAYLEGWTDLAPRAELVETLELACRVATIARSLTWLRAVGDGSEPQWADAPLRTLASLLDG
jgi:hypothetical protein